MNNADRLKILKTNTLLLSEFNQSLVALDAEQDSQKVREHLAQMKETLSSLNYKENFDGNSWDVGMNAYGALAFHVKTSPMLQQSIAEAFNKNSLDVLVDLIPEMSKNNKKEWLNTLKKYNLGKTEPNLELASIEEQIRKNLHGLFNGELTPNDSKEALLLLVQESSEKNLLFIESVMTRTTLLWASQAINDSSISPEFVARKIGEATYDSNYNINATMLVHVLKNKSLNEHLMEGSEIYNINDTTVHLTEFMDGVRSKGDYEDAINENQRNYLIKLASDITINRTPQEWFAVQNPSVSQALQYFKTMSENFNRTLSRVSYEGPRFKKIGPDSNPDLEVNGPSKNKPSMI